MRWSILGNERMDKREWRRDEINIVAILWVPEPVLQDGASVKHFEKFEDINVKHTYCKWYLELLW